MKDISGIINKFSNIIEDVKKLCIDEMYHDRTPDEPSITGRFLAILQNEINQHGAEKLRIKGLRITSSIIQDRGKNSPEHRLGADFSILLDIDIVGFKLKKGFLCQAKKEASHMTLKSANSPTTVSFYHNAEFIRLQDQARRMLQVTPDSFVMLYSVREFVVVPAISIVGLNDKGALYAKRIKDFFGEFLMCFIGDQTINDDQHYLLTLKENAEKILKIEIREEEGYKNKRKKTPSTTNHEMISTNSSLFEEQQEIASIIS